MKARMGLADRRSQSEESDPPEEASVTVTLEKIKKTISTSTFSLLF